MNVGINFFLGKNLPKSLCWKSKFIREIWCQVASIHHLGSHFCQDELLLTFDFHKLAVMLVFQSNVLDFKETVDKIIRSAA